MFFNFQALKISEEPKNKAILLKNRAAVYLKQEDYNATVKDCNAGMGKISNNNYNFSFIPFF